MAKIIVVDDEPTHLDFVATILERAGHDVVAIGNGADCLERIEANAFDVMVADIFMPDLDGLRLLAAMRARGSRIPVIGMTGGMKGVVAPFADIMSRMGARSVLTKPFSGDELLRAVQASLTDGPDREG